MKIVDGETLARREIDRLRMVLAEIAGGLVGGHTDITVVRTDDLRAILDWTDEASDYLRDHGLLDTKEDASRPRYRRLREALGGAFGTLDIALWRKATDALTANQFHRYEPPADSWDES